MEFWLGGILAFLMGFFIAVWSSMRLWRCVPCEHGEPMKGWYAPHSESWCKGERTRRKG